MKPGVRFVQSDDPLDRPGGERVETDAGTFEADVLVVALGADLDPAATPGLVEGGHEFYTVAGAFALRDVLPQFRTAARRSSAWRAIVQVPARAKRDRAAAARLPHRARTTGAAEISLVMPFGTPIPRRPTRRRRSSPPSPSAASGS